MLRALLGGGPPGSVPTPGGAGPMPGDDPLMALMSSFAQAGGGGGGFPGAPRPPGSSADVAPDDPLMALMSSMTQGGPGGMGGGGMFGAPPAVEKPKPLAQRLLPLLHIVSVWCLVAWFVLFKEPQTFHTEASSAVLPGGIWRRWAELGSRTAAESTWGVAAESTWGVQVVVRFSSLYDTVSLLTLSVQPFFWAFITLELALHSLRIFSGFVRIPLHTFCAH